MVAALAALSKVEKVSGKLASPDGVTKLFVRDRRAPDNAACDGEAVRGAIEAGLLELAVHFHELMTEVIFDRFKLEIELYHLRASTR